MMIQFFNFEKKSLYTLFLSIMFCFLLFTNVLEVEPCFETHKSSFQNHIFVFNFTRNSSVYLTKVKTIIEKLR